MEYLALCSRAPGNELIAAECQALTGGIPGADGLASCWAIDRVRQAAYLSTGIRLVARGQDPQALASDLIQQNFVSDKFRIEFQSLSAGGYSQSQEALLAVADAINGAPDLSHPQHRFLLIHTDKVMILGEVLVEAERTYKKHDEKPYRTSSSLPSQLARALVNLAYPASSILDPCCGTGSILLEACATGVKAFGLDRNPKMAGMTRRNLIHFGYEASIQRGDAPCCSQAVEAVVTDLPYGRFLKHDEVNLKAILHQMATLAPLGIYLAEQDITTWLREAGYRQVEVFQVRKRAGMTRYVNRAQTE